MFQYRAVTYFLIVGMIFTILSTPFIAGVLQPAMALQNPYVFMYAVVTLPVIFILRDVISWVADLFWDTPSPENVQVTGIWIAGLFWSLFGSVMGQYKDVREGRRSLS